MNEDEDGYEWKEGWVEIRLCWEQGCLHFRKAREIAEYIKKHGVKSIPPVVLFNCQTDKLYRPCCPKGKPYYIFDGRHRIDALKLLGYSKVYARIYNIPTILRWKKLEIPKHAYKVRTIKGRPE